VSDADSALHTLEAAQFQATLLEASAQPA
jgi:hypothetical protein